MILGIGADVCSVARIEASLQRFGDRLAQRVLSEIEFARFASHANRANYLAKRFAAKEAFGKALGTGIHAPVSWKAIVVLNERSGKPYVAPSASLQALLDRRGVRRAHITITDERDLALAFVVLED